MDHWISQWRLAQKKDRKMRESATRDANNDDDDDNDDDDEDEDEDDHDDDDDEEDDDDAYFDCISTVFHAYLDSYLDRIHFRNP